METQNTKGYLLAVFFTCWSLSVIIAEGIVLPEEGEELNASKYQKIIHGERTASGEPYDGAALSCSHPSLPFGTVIRIQNQLTGRSIDVKVNDRSAKARGEIRLSEAAAFQLDVTRGKTVPVVATPIGMTTAKLEPDYSFDRAKSNRRTQTPRNGNGFQFDAIPVSFGGSNDSTDQTTPMQPEVVPVTFISKEDEHSQYPPMFSETPGEVRGQDFAPSMARNANSDQPAQYRNSTPDEPGYRQSNVMAANRSSHLPVPMRAQFGAYGDATSAYRLSHQLNAIGFQTVVLVNHSNLYCVVTKGTFSDDLSASQWVEKVEATHQRALTLVRL